MFACAALSWAIVLPLAAAMVGTMGYIETADWLIDAGRIVFALAMALLLGSMLSARRLQADCRPIFPKPRSPR